MDEGKAREQARLRESTCINVDREIDRMENGEREERERERERVERLPVRESNYRARIAPLAAT